MRGLVVPERTEDFTADPVELFFDLAFVFAFSQLVYHLIHEPTWTGAGEAFILFAVLWFSWSIFTWSANAVSGNGRVVRAIFLVATATSVPMSASVSTAWGSGGQTFAICAAIINLMAMALQAASFDRDTAEFRWIARNGIPIACGLGLLLLGGFLDGNARTVFWILFSLVIFGMLLFAGEAAWGVRSGHFAERHGLILIIALGEVIVAIGISVVNSLRDGEGLTTPVLVGMTAAGVLAGLLWWSYFDRVLPALEHRLEDTSDDITGHFARDVYTMGHVPIVGGIITLAAAGEEVLLHPSDEIHTEFRIMLVAGIAMFLLGIAGTVARAFRIVAKERIAATVAIAALVALGGSLSGVTILVAIDVILAIALLVEHQRVEGSSR